MYIKLKKRRESRRFVKEMNLKNKELNIPCLDALFVGWQEKLTGDVFPLYVVTLAGHPYYGSSVSEKTLTELNLKFSKQENSKK